MSRSLATSHCEIGARILPVKCCLSFLSNSFYLLQTKPLPHYHTNYTEQINQTNSEQIFSVFLCFISVDAHGIIIFFFALAEMNTITTQRMPQFVLQYTDTNEWINYSLFFPLLWFYCKLLKLNFSGLIANRAAYRSEICNDIPFFWLVIIYLRNAKMSAKMYYSRQKFFRLFLLLSVSFSIKIYSNTKWTFFPPA